MNSKTIGAANGLVVLFWLFLVLPLSAQTIKEYRTPADTIDYLLIEAEGFSELFNQQSGPSWVSTAENGVSGMSADTAGGGSGNGLHESKLVYYLHLEPDTTYTLYVRYLLTDTASSITGFAVGDGFGSTSYNQGGIRFPESPDGDATVASVTTLRTGNDGQTSLLLFPDQSDEIIIDKILLSAGTDSLDSFDGLEPANCTFIAPVGVTNYASPDDPNTNPLDSIDGTNVVLISSPEDSGNEPYFPYSGQSYYSFEGGGENNGNSTLTFKENIRCLGPDITIAFSFRFLSTQSGGFDNDDTITVTGTIFYPNSSEVIQEEISGSRIGTTYTFFSLGLTVDQNNGEDSDSVRFTINYQGNANLYVDDIVVTEEAGGFPNAEISATNDLGGQVTFGTPGLTQDNFEGSSTIDWDFGDGNTSTESAPTHVYQEDGTYEACYTYTFVEGSAPNCDYPQTIACTILVITNAILPVEFLFFHARPVDQATALHWATATELNNDRFELQHSRDGGPFVTVATIPGQGTTTARTDYHYRHERPGSGTHYYRLKQVDFDGTYSYSSVQSVSVGSKHTYDFFPNPVDDQLQLVTPAGKERDYAILDLQGRLVRQGPVDGSPVPVDGLPRGIYLLQVREPTGQIAYNARFVKQ